MTFRYSALLSRRKICTIYFTPGIFDGRTFKRGGFFWRLYFTSPFTVILRTSYGQARQDVRCFTFAFILRISEKVYLAGASNKLLRTSHEHPTDNREVYSDMFFSRYLTIILRLYGKIYFSE